MQETWVWSLGGKDHLKKGKATYTPVFWPGEFHGRVHGVAESPTLMSNFHFHSLCSNITTSIDLEIFWGSISNLFPMEWRSLWWQSVAEQWPPKQIMSWTRHLLFLFTHTRYLVLSAYHIRKHYIFSLSWNERMKIAYCQITWSCSDLLPLLTIDYHWNLEKILDTMRVKVLEREGRDRLYRKHSQGDCPSSRTKSKYFQSHSGQN